MRRRRRRLLFCGEGGPRSRLFARSGLGGMVIGKAPARLSQANLNAVVLLGTTFLVEQNDLGDRFGVVLLGKGRLFSTARRGGSLALGNQGSGSLAEAAGIAGEGRIGLRSLGGEIGVVGH